MIAFNYYQDRQGMNHTGIICLNCGTIHDCIMSFVKIVPSLLGIGNPYKIVNVELLPVWSMEVAEHKENFGINCRESAVMAVGIPEHIINTLRARRKLGECFDLPISITYDEYQSKKNNFVLKQLSDNPSHFGLNY